MIGSKQLDTLMNTPMSRKQFLRYIGMMLLSIVGVGNVVAALLQSHPKAARPALPRQDIKARNGFGGGKYGA